MTNTALLTKGKSNFLSKLLIYFLITLLAIITLLPFYWMIVCSLKSNADFYNPVASLFTQNPIVDNYINLFKKTNFARWFLNSFLVSILSTVLGLAMCSMAGFAFAVYKFKFKNLIFWTVLISVAIPQIVTIIPVFRLMVSIGLIDNYLSLVLPYAVSMFGIFMMRQYIASSFPKDLLDAARIDGLSEFGIYLKVVLPIIRPGLAVLGIYLWLSSWSGYFWPLIMLKSRDMMTMPLGLATLYANPWNLEWGIMMAGSFLSTLPIIILFLVAQEQFMSGLTSGAVKG